MDTEKFTVLYVDDEEQNLVSFRATFRRDYTIYTAISGEEGLEIMANNQISLVITDQRMPEMTGIQFLEKVIPEYPDTIRMVLTGFSDIEVIIEAINTGRVFRYINKPWDDTELKMTIENARQVYDLQVNNKTLMSQLKQKVEEQEKTLKLFTKYVPESIVQKSLNSSIDTIFDGEVREIAVLFCDIRGFTPMSEELSPKEIVSFLNDFYSLMTEIIQRHNGSVNQFVGDEVFAAFGAPLSFPDNETNAVFCGIEMIEKLPILSQKYQGKIKKEIQVGIGINSGEVVAGNLGSEERIDYSLTGDTVNTGKRIETITIDHPNSILISDAVYQKTKAHLNVKKWEPLHVKGKKDKITVYEVLGRK
jgi:class 3 adenylate cyclase/ActR/RegA family two-component response regulator